MHTLPWGMWTPPLVISLTPVCYMLESVSPYLLGQIYFHI